MAEGLTVPMRDLLWQVGQHKYGWTHVSRLGGQLQVADALVERGLVAYSSPNDRDSATPTIVAVTAGQEEIRRRWPISPFVLHTYEPPPDGWQASDGSQPFKEHAHAASPTQQQFDLSTFRKEVEERLKRRKKDYANAARRGHVEDECFAEGWEAALDFVLALLPGDGE